MRKIVTSHIYPPIPIRTHDWCAYFDGEEEAGNYGYGATREEAIADFMTEAVCDGRVSAADSLRLIDEAINCTAALKWTRVNDEWVQVETRLERNGLGWKETTMKLISPGTRFGALVVEKLAAGPRSGAYFECRCDCGEITTAQGSAMRHGRKTSCGCKSGQHPPKYQVGSSADPEYSVWRAAISRCTSPSNKKWPLYGARGIRVCERWLESYDAFLTDMGRRPSDGYSLDRIDGNGNYEPGNCRWATAEVQNNNRSNNRRMVVDGAVMTIAQASRATGIPDATLRRQIIRGPGGLSDRPATTATITGAK